MNERKTFQIEPIQVIQTFLMIFVPIGIVFAIVALYLGDPRPGDRMYNIGLRSAGSAAISLFVAFSALGALAGILNSAKCPRTTFTVDDTGITVERVGEPEPVHYAWNEIDYATEEKSRYETKLLLYVHSAEHLLLRYVPGTGKVYKTLREILNEKVEFV